MHTIHSVYYTEILFIHHLIIQLLENLSIICKADIEFYLWVFSPSALTVLFDITKY